MNNAPLRFIAVDWSGDKTNSGQRRKIWIADWNEGQVTLTQGRLREEVTKYLIGASQQTSEMVIGLDFAFSFPGWFLRAEGHASAEAFWKSVSAGKGEEWVTTPNAFCWGGKGIKCPRDHGSPDWRGFRRTELDLRTGSDGSRFHPKSVFQIGGAGAVGTGTLRGIPHLLALKNAGFSIWPFDRPSLPAVIEIYPRLFTGRAKVSSCRARAAHLSQPPFGSLPEEVLEAALDSEDAFDALCSVIGMKDHAEELGSLERESDPDLLLEGKIWQPRLYSNHAS